MKKIILAALAAPFFACGLTFAAGDAGVKLDHAPINLKDQASLQRGARNFVNYCLNCHNAAFMRYSHLTQIGLTEQQIKDNLMFTTDKIGDTMVSALDPKDAKEWLGTLPPDLTLVARVRGSDWLYTFLRSFRRDEGSSTGWNNDVFPNTAMPHVLHELQGVLYPQQVGEKPGHDGKMHPVMKLVQEKPGVMSTAEYDEFVTDLVNYLTYMGEPAQTERTRIGVIVLFFLTFMFFIVLWLKNEYWKDVK